MRLFISRRLIIALLLVLQPTHVWSRGSAVPADDALKVAFIVNFTKFIEWPDPAGQDAARAEIIVAVWDFDSLAPVLSAYGDQALSKQRVRFVPAPVDCTQHFDVLYINSDDSDDIADAIRCATLSGPVLTIGETARFPGLGGMINFIPRNDTIGFELNLNAIESQKLSVSSHLIRLGTVVKGAEPSAKLTGESGFLVTWGGGHHVSE